MIYLKCPKRFKEFAWQCIEYLGMENLKGDIEITTNKSLRAYYGLAWGDREEVEIEISTFGKHNLKQLRSTIAHELVHARQYLTGQLYNGYGHHGTTVFKGRAYNHYMDADKQPWEREAEKLEKEMMDFFFPE